jgi:hypothetical protein
MDLAPQLVSTLSFLWNVELFFACVRGGGTEVRSRQWWLSYGMVWYGAVRYLEGGTWRADADVDADVCLSVCESSMGLLKIYESCLEPSCH